MLATVGVGWNRAGLGVLGDKGVGSVVCFAGVWRVRGFCITSWFYFWAEGGGVVVVRLGG